MTKRAASQIDETLLLKLQDRAAHEGCSANELLARWLATDSRPMPGQHILQDHQLLKALADNYPRGYVSIVNDDWTISFTAGAEFKRLAVNSDRLIGMTLDEVFAAYDDQIVAVIQDHYQRAFAGEEAYFELELTPGLHQSYHMVPLHDSEGHIPRILTVVEDITERKKAEYDLRESQERYRLLADLTFEGIIIHDNGTIRDVNPSVLAMFGYARDALIGVEAIDLLFAPESRHLIGQQIQKGRTDRYEAVGLHQSGYTFPIEIEARQIKSDLRVASIRDISDRKQMERDLRIKEKAIETSITAIALADLAGNLTYVNRAFLDMWQLEDVSQAIGRSVLDFWVSPEAAQQVVIELAQNAHYVGELTALMPDQSQLLVELTASMVQDEQGNPICMMGSFRDVSARKQAEMIAIENERIKAQFQKEQDRSAVMERVISMLSHDLRVPLAVISSSRQLLYRYGNKLSLERRQEKLETIARQVQFALEILEDTVNVARGNLNERNFAPHPINLAALCEVSINENRIAQQSANRITFVNRSNITTAMVDDVLISRILINLLGNAVKYSPNGEDINLILDRDDDHIILSVIDHGFGIDSEDLPHIFNPFYRAEEAQSMQGTGLGLSIVQECVDRHGGHITVESVVGQGSTFTVKLPLEPVPEVSPDQLGHQ